MKIRIFAGEKPVQKELVVPDDTRVIVLNRDGENSVVYETEHGIVDKNDKPLIVFGANKI